MDHKLYLIIFIFIKIEFVISENNNSNILFDQRQSGKYNIHLSIKDVAIIEFGGNDFVDDTSNDKEDYYYDDENLTIKPWFSSTTTLKTPFISSPSINTTITKSTTNNLSTTTIYDTTIKNDFNVTNSTNNFNIENNTPTLLAQTRKPLFSNKPQDIPVQIIMEPVLIPKLRTTLSHKLRSQSNQDSRVLRLKAKYHTQFPRMNIRCDNGGFLNDNCRPKRSTILKSLFLKKMFNVLKKLTNNKAISDTST